MDDTLKIFAAVSSAVGLGQMLLFWVTRRSRKIDVRDERELSLESSFLAERRELLTSLRAQLVAEQTRGSRLETEKVALLREVFSLQKFANEVLAKYDFLRTLNPASNLPVIRLEAAREFKPGAAGDVYPPEAADAGGARAHGSRSKDGADEDHHTGERSGESQGGNPERGEAGIDAGSRGSRDGCPTKQNRASEGTENGEDHERP